MTPKTGFIIFISLLFLVPNASATATSIFASDVLRQSANPLTITGTYTGSWNIFYGAFVEDADGDRATATAILKKNGIGIDSISNTQRVSTTAAKTVTISGNLNPGDVYTVEAVGSCGGGCAEVRPIGVELRYSIVGATPTPTPQPTVIATLIPTPQPTVILTPIQTPVVTPKTPTDKQPVSTTAIGLIAAGLILVVVLGYTKYKR